MVLFPFEVLTEGEKIMQQDYTSILMQCILELELSCFGRPYA